MHTLRLQNAPRLVQAAKNAATTGPGSSLSHLTGEGSLIARTTLESESLSGVLPRPVAPSLVPAAPRPAAPIGPSAQSPDWLRESCAMFAWKPAQQLLRALRSYERTRVRTDLLGKLQKKWAVLRHRFWSAVTGADIPLNASHIAGGLMLPHPNGVVLHPDVVIGPNCALFQQVTVGTGPRPGVPTLGGHVDVGPGAKILGGVTIGDHAIIGANAVVIDDVPAGAVAVGIPAVVKGSARGR